jgi:hypothetical protein
VPNDDDDNDDDDDRQLYRPEQNTYCMLSIIFLQLVHEWDNV